MFVTNHLNFITSFGTIWLIAEWLIRIVCLFVVPRNRKPSSATAWLLVIFLFPSFGLILFLILGSPKLPKSRRDAQKTLDKFITQSLTEFKNNKDKNNLLHDLPGDKYLPIAKLSQSLGHFPVFGGNSVNILPYYDKAIGSIVKDIEKAEHLIHIEYFIIALDETTEPLFIAMAEAVKRGVSVRVLYDSFSTKKTANFKNMIKRLKSDGITYQEMLPLRLGKNYVRPDLRNHRKLIVIDGKVGYTGSQNLIQRNYHRKDSIYYDELVVRLNGPIALQLGAVFMTDWFCETGDILLTKEIEQKITSIDSYGTSLAQILPSGPGYDDENNLKLFTSLIHTARTKITIVNPYFVPDDALTTAITSAAKRGVEVILINSEVMDQWMVGHAQRSFYEVLLKSGVKIYSYNPPILLHSKFITIDGQTATIGSSNLDIRSFELDLEVTLICYDQKVVKDLDKVAAKYLEKSKELSLKLWLKRPKKKILLDNIARLTSALQ